MSRIRIMQRASSVVKTLLIFVISFSLLHLESAFVLGFASADLNAPTWSMPSDEMGSSNDLAQVSKDEILSLASHEQGHEDSSHGARDLCLLGHHCSHSHCFHALASRSQISSHLLVFVNHVLPSDGFIDSPFLDGIFRPPALL